MQKIEMHNSENIDNTSLKMAISYDLNIEEITAKNILFDRHPSTSICS